MATFGFRFCVIIRVMIWLRIRVKIRVSIRVRFRNTARVRFSINDRLSYVYICVRVGVRVRAMHYASFRVRITCMIGTRARASVGIRVRMMARIRDNHHFWLRVCCRV